MTMIHFSEVSLSNQNKKGILKPDENGYYTMIIGGLNVFNSVDQYYTLQGSKDLFESSSIFMRRVKSGNLKGEVGHPKRVPGMSIDDYVHRIMSVEDTNVCVHISEVWLDTEFGKNNPKHGNPNLVAMYGKLKPSGPKGDALKAAFENPKENVCFSIRALTDDRLVNGTQHRKLVQIVTWDWVIEPGIHIANKWATPVLENLTDVTISKDQLYKVAKESMDDTLIANESSREIFRETMSLFNTGNGLTLQW